MIQANNPEVVKTFRSDGMQASIWKNKVQGQGQRSKRYSVSIQRQSRAESGIWQEAHSFVPEDFPAINLVILDAYVYLCNREAIPPTKEHVAYV